MKNDKIVHLIEAFRSFQGEGPDSGKAMYILRFKTCDRKCPWCDTSVKMRISMEAPYQLLDIKNMLDRDSAGLLITGGEPTVPRHFDETVMLLNSLDYPIANVETNGFNVVELLKNIDYVNKPIKVILSPKVFNKTDFDFYSNILKEVHDHPALYLKFVYEPENRDCIAFLEYIRINYPNLVKEQRVWLMPEGTTRSELITNAEKVFDACEKYNFNFSSRSHIIYGFV